MNTEPAFIAEPSVLALRLEIKCNGGVLASGTGFLTQAVLGPALITNRHIVTGRHQDSGEFLSRHAVAPTHITIRHNGTVLGEYTEETEPLYTAEGRPRWYEHPVLGSSCDVIALPITDSVNIRLLTVLPFIPPSFRLIPGEHVSVIGYPFGMKGAGDLAIWSTGFIATEISLDYGGLPQFLIDCRARPGQSGSPVLAYRQGMTSYRDGTSRQLAMPAYDFLGVYSGRINDQSDIGRVWKASALADILNEGVIAKLS